MSAAVKAMPTPVPPPERRVQWQPPGGSGAAFGGVKINGGNFGSADLPPAAGQPKQQRPQSAVVHSMNRRLTAPGASGLDARRSDDIKIEGFPAGEKSHREVGKMSAEGTSILPHAGGSGGTSGARNRPQSAMPTVNRGGSASAAEKIEIEDLKREILEVTKRIASNRKDLQDSVLLTGAQDGSLQRVQSVEETESALKRFIPTSDSAQVQQAKNALLCTLLQKLEELNRDTLSALNHRHRTSTGDAWARRLPQGRGSSRSLAGVMLAVSDKTHAVSRDFVALKEDTTASATQLAEAQTQIKALMEERELLRATLTQAAKAGHSTIKLARPVSAPRARQPPTSLETPMSSRPSPGACAGCGVLQVRVHETQVLLEAAEEEKRVLAAKVEALCAEEQKWRRQAQAPLPKPEPAETADAPKTPSPPPVAADSSKELAALKRKVAELEKALAGKKKEAAEARDAAAKEKKKCEAAVKASADKDVRIKHLEAQLAQALAMVTSLEKRLSDASLHVKAPADSTDGAAEREKALRLRVEVLTKEVLEARKEADNHAARAEKEAAAKEKLKEKLAEERSEAEGIQKKLILELKEAKNKAALAEAEAARVSTEFDKARARLVVLEEELDELRRRGSAAAGGMEGMEAKVDELRRLLAASEEAGAAAAAARTKAEEEAAALRARLAAREREMRAQVEAREGEFAAEREELMARVRELEGAAKGADGDKAELQLLRSRVRWLTEEVDGEKKKAGEARGAAEAAEAEARAVRGDLRVVKDEKDVLVIEVQAKAQEMEDLRKKLLAALRRAESADQAVIRMEGEREETRAVENAFKTKMKALYEKRVRELEGMQQEFEQRVVRENEERQRAERAVGAGGRPATTSGRRAR